MKKRTTILTALTLTGILATGCAAATTQVSRIDLNAAKAAAIEAAGFSEADVTFLSAELDSRNGIEFYDIDFNADGKEYDYDIDALTGMVIGSETPERADKEIVAAPVKATEVPVEELTLKLEETASVSNAVPAKSEASAKITEDEAKKIALAQVPGAKETDIRGFEIDYDDGRLEYEGSIFYGELEYEFEIDGYSGAIRSWEVESIYD
jgi:uncharacterized membrane protein YkoI